MQELGKPPFVNAPDTVVLDTNVVLDWFVFADPGVAALARAIESGQMRWLGCPAMNDELAHVLSLGSLSARGISAERVLTSIERLQTQVMAPDPHPLPGLQCRDRSDQVFVDLALQVGATWLFSRDRALLALARKAAQRGLAIVTPRRWQDDPQRRGR